jgi:oxepin-CoA hydrolase/3-oxo-5,6-dehydrosuberyl-CoA semialdehyde dehydrogenase
MENAMLKFLSEDFTAHLKQLDESTPPVFGKMNVCQMIEHMSDSFRIANGKDPHSILTPAERLQPMKAFLMSEKDFRPNTPNALLPDQPVPCRNSSKAAAIAELETEIRDFIRYFEINPGSTLTNPFFGDLNFSEWIRLLHKHSLHHLRQFALQV